MSSPVMARELVFAWESVLSELAPWHWTKDFWWIRAMFDRIMSRQICPSLRREVAIRFKTSVVVGFAKMMPLMVDNIFDICCVPLTA